MMLGQYRSASSARYYYVIFEWLLQFNSAEIVQFERWYSLHLRWCYRRRLIGAAIGCKVSKIDFSQFADLGAWVCFYRLCTPLGQFSF